MFSYSASFSYLSRPCNVIMSATNEINKKYKMVDTGGVYWTMCDRLKGLPAAWPFEVNHSFHTALAQAGRIHAQMPKRYQEIYDQRNGIFGSPETHIFAHIADDDVACMYQGKSKEDDIWRYNFLAQMDRVAGNVLAMARTGDAWENPYTRLAFKKTGGFLLCPIIDPRKMDWEVDMNPANGYDDKPFHYMHRKMKEKGELFEPTFIYPGYTITMRRDIMERLASAESCLLTASVAVAVKDNLLYGPQFVLHFYFDRLLCIYEMDLSLPSDMDDDDEGDVTEAAFVDKVSKAFDDEFVKGCQELENMDLEISSDDETTFSKLAKYRSKSYL